MLIIMIECKYMYYCIEELVQPLLLIINQSLSLGIMPSSMKSATVRPLLKKPGMDKNVMSNYRPVSNLTFTSKVIERVVAAQLEDHFTINCLHDPVQSAYKRHHSTETALVKVLNDITHLIDGNYVVALVMLDLSAAFDTVDHTILLQRLESSCGVTGTALKWFESYLTERSQCVHISGHTSSGQMLKFGVPQGSVLGPKAFCLYTKPLGKIIEKHNTEAHFYADDSQLYIALKPRDVLESLSSLEACIADIRQWMRSNFLKLNDSKTEFILLGPKPKVRSLNVRLKIGDSEVTPAPVVKNLGVIWDSELSMEKQVNALARSCHLQFRNISRVRRYLTIESTKTLVAALVMSKVDYANAVLYGISKRLLDRLQRIQNTAARIITRTRRTQHITSVLRDLHWLPISYRIQYKMMTLVWRALHDTAPQYMKDLLTVHVPVRSLRSKDKMLLHVPKTRTIRFGSRSFQYAAPTIWNSLPVKLRTTESYYLFKADLKTYLFSVAFNNV